MLDNGTLAERMRSLRFVRKSEEVCAPRFDYVVGIVSCGPALLSPKDR